MDAIPRLTQLEHGTVTFNVLVYLKVHIMNKLRLYRI